MNDDTFTLSRSPAPIRGKRQICQNNDATRQTVLFAGLACLPGQNDLFPTDGAAGNDEARMTNDEGEEPAEFGEGITREDAEDLPERYCSHCNALMGTIVETIGENRYHPACWEKVAFPADFAEVTHD